MSQTSADKTHTGQPKRLTVDDPQALPQAAVTLRSGALVVAPTETRYGLLARADSAAAVDRLFELKGRSGAPSAIFVSSATDLWRYLKKSPPAEKLAGAFLPGPLTLVGEATAEAVKSLSPRVVSGGTIGVRVSAAAFIAALVTATGAPLTATSANPSGAGDFKKIDEIVSAFGADVGLYIDGGALTGTTSTVVKVDDSGVSILRHGAITDTEINRALTGAL